MATLGTAMGTAAEGDGVLQIIDGDEVTVRYVDTNTVTGSANVLREELVQVVLGILCWFTSAPIKALRIVHLPVSHVRGAGRR